MIIGFDIGNSNVTIGCFQENEIEPTVIFAIQTGEISSFNEMESLIQKKLNQEGYAVKKITGSIYCSVVPRLDSAIEEFLEKNDIPKIKVTSNTKTGIDFQYDKIADLGADRIVNAVAVFELYKQNENSIVIDLGTATTFCVLVKERVFKGGIIAPGLNMFLNSLSKNTAQLFDVEFREPGKVIGQSTKSALESGIHYGFLSMIRELIFLIKKELGSPFQIILTGGHSSAISDFLKIDHTSDLKLTLKGLKILFDWNK